MAVTHRPARWPRSRRDLTFAILTLSLVLAVACAMQGPTSVVPQEWWDGFGPVIPHESFPGDCSLCHVSDSWNQIRDDFLYDHGAETGFELAGAHRDAQCLRCHNDRGPVQIFQQRGCAGCHEDIHLGQLGSACQDCHGVFDWRPQGQIARHNRTRFPLFGAHSVAPCYRCHPGAEVGVFVPTDTECVSCHRDDLARAQSPNHVALGWVSGCDRCHVPTTWTGTGFNHPFFPLSGAHGGLSCTSCHPASGSFGTFTCVDCHAHRKPDMDKEHEDVTGYVYDSRACLSCHPGGSG